jgi:endoglucanase
MDTFETLKQLTETPGPSGMETGIAGVVRSIWEPLAGEIQSDRLGNLLAIKRGRGSENREQPLRLLVAAHMDEIGLMVNQIEHYPDEDGYGFLRLTNVGGVDLRHLYGQQVIVHGERDLPGIIGALPVHMLPESRRSDSYGFEELVVDVGLRAEELRELVNVGDFISFVQPMRKLLNDRATGKAVDNRASVVAVAVALEYLQGRLHEWDVIAAATVQEETRLLGAFTSAFDQHPDVAVALDVTFAKGPGTKDGELFELDDGPTLGLGPNVHPVVLQKLKDAADALEMKVHMEPHARASGTDAYGLQVARAGIPTGLISIPLRYMHTMVETVALADIERAGRLLGEFIARLDGSFPEEVNKEMMGE